MTWEQTTEQGNTKGKDHRRKRHKDWRLAYWCRGMGLFVKKKESEKRLRGTKSLSNVIAGKREWWIIRNVGL